MLKIYKRYVYNDYKNEYGYFEAISMDDCDAFVLTDKTVEGLKDQIDEL